MSSPKLSDKRWFGFLQRSLILPCAGSGALRRGVHIRTGSSISPRLQSFLHENARRHEPTPVNWIERVGAPLIMTGSRPRLPPARSPTRFPTAMLRTGPETEFPLLRADLPQADRVDVGPDRLT